MEILESVDLFEASAKLQYASSLLTCLTEGRDLDEKGSKILKWAGQLLRRVDSRSGAWSRVGISPGLAVQATSVRPVFYATLLGLSEDFSKAGITKEDEVFTFLQKLYTLLNEGGTKPTLTPGELCLASEFLHGFSCNLLARISHNGVPNEPSVFAFGV